MPAQSSCSPLWGLSSRLFRPNGGWRPPRSSRRTTRSRARPPPSAQFSKADPVLAFSAWPARRASSRTCRFVRFHLGLLLLWTGGGGGDPAAPARGGLRRADSSYEKREDYFRALPDTQV